MPSDFPIRKKPWEENRNEILLIINQYSSNNFVKLRHRQIIISKKLIDIYKNKIWQIWYYLKISKRWHKNVSTNKIEVLWN